MEKSLQDLLGRVVAILLPFKTTLIQNSQHSDDLSVATLSFTSALNFKLEKIIENREDELQQISPNMVG